MASVLGSRGLMNMVWFPMLTTQWNVLRKPKYVLSNEPAHARVLLTNYHVPTDFPMGQSQSPPWLTLKRRALQRLFPTKFFWKIFVYLLEIQLWVATPFRNGLSLLLLPIFPVAWVLLILTLLLGYDGHVEGLRNGLRHYCIVAQHRRVDCCY